MHQHIVHTRMLGQVYSLCASVPMRHAAGAVSMSLTAAISGMQHGVTWLDRCNMCA